MTGQDEFDRMLAGWFEANALSPVPTGRLARVVGATRRRRPRPVWLARLGSHWVGEGPDRGSTPSRRWLPGLGLRWSAALVLLLIGALVAGAIVVGARLFASSLLPSGQHGDLAYALDGDIYLADQNGRDPVRVADGDPDNGSAGCGPRYAAPAWSPDGRYLAYRSGFNQVACEQNGGAVGVGSPPADTVNISDPDGRLVASVPGFGWAIAWSPDSTRFATWLDWDSEAIGVYALDGTREAVVTLPPGFGVYRDEDALWSPDGASLLISLRPDPGGELRQIWALPVDGGPPVVILPQRNVTYSPDGLRLAFTTHPNPDAETLAATRELGWLPSIPPGSLVVAAADLSSGAVLIGGEGPSGRVVESPVWSPAGDLIAFVLAPFDDASVPQVREIRVVDVATAAEISLADGRERDRLEVISFSPEGDRIVFSRSDVNGERSLWSVRADGSSAQLLVAGTDDGAWRPLPDRASSDR